MVLVELSILEGLIILSGFFLAFVGWLGKFRPAISGGGIMLVLVAFEFFVSEPLLMLGFFFMGLFVTLWGFAVDVS